MVDQSRHHSLGRIPGHKGFAVPTAIGTVRGCRNNQQQPTQKEDNMSDDTTAAASAASKRSYRKWTAEELETMKSCSSLGVSTVATMLNRPKVAIYNKAKQLGISVSAKVDASADSQV